MRWLKGTPNQKPDQPRSKGRHWFSTSALREALQGTGCPVCVAATFSERRGLRSFLYEGMMSASVRGDFLKSGGFCALHFAMGMEIETECWQAGGIGMAILCEDLVRHAMADAEQASYHGDRRDGFEPGFACMFCEEKRRKERALVDVLEELADEDEFRGPLQNGRMCFTHAQLAIQSWTVVEKREWVKTALADRASRLSEDLRELIRKYDYQFKDEPKGREQGAVRRSAEFLFGTRYARKKAVP
jgi:hypothetical protein